MPMYIAPIWGFRLADVSAHIFISLARQTPIQSMFINVYLLVGAKKKKKKKGMEKKRKKERGGGVL